ncbi:MAG: DUF488 domain-containing protein [Planctomycetes bacterium]|nr:DUF488 domain-containing protein [Planctomycetota bacterium]
MNIFTIGHSNRPLEEFLDLLAENSIGRLADVRRFPGSKRHPHFGKDGLAAALGERRLEYRHFPGLGGFRKARPDSPHQAWETAGFRGYAGHMETAEFQAALAELEEWAREFPAVVMCAEASPFSCHRQLIADALLRDGFTVAHILGKGRISEHKLTYFARLEGDRIVYDLGVLPLG